MKEQPSMIIEEGSRFSCVPHCGFCCGFWDIQIDRQRKEALLAKEWILQRAEELQKPKAQDLFKILGQGETSLLQRRNGTCSFIDEQMFCSIHARDGLDAKPSVCQQFPNIYYQTPRGIEVYLDFSCPEVIKNAGELVTEESVRVTLPREFVQNVGDRFPLDAKTSLDWQGYLQLEEIFLQVLASEVRYEEKILALDRIVKGVAQSLCAPGDGSHLSQSGLAGLQGQRIDEFLQTRSISRDISKRDLYTAILIQWVESSYSGEVRQKPIGVAGVLINVLKQWIGMGPGDFRVFKLKLDYGRVRQVTFDAQEGKIRQPLDRYLRYLVKTLVGTGTVSIQKRIAIMAANFALIKWLSRGHAASRAGSQVGPEDVVFGVKVVEKFLSNRLFNRLEQMRNPLANYIGLLFANPALPQTMLAVGDRETGPGKVP